MKTPLLIIAAFVLILVSCQQGGTTHDQPAQAAAVDSPATSVPDPKSDSIAVLDLLKKVYRWHAANQTKLPDFPVLVKDSFQTGLDYVAFDSTFRAIRGTGLFAEAFMENYKKIADSVNRRLTSAHPPLYNEINFSYQDVDLWTASQEDYPDLWDHFTITDFRSDGRAAASLQWSYHEKGFSSVKYPVRFEKAGGQWRVAYMSLFDINTALRP